MPGRQLVATARDELGRPLCRFLISVIPATSAAVRDFFRDESLNTGDDCPLRRG